MDRKMNETNLIASLDEIEVHKQENFVILKGKTQGDFVITLGIEQIPWLHEALNYLYEIRANRD